MIKGQWYLYGTGGFPTENYPVPLCYIERQPIIHRLNAKRKTFSPAVSNRLFGRYLAARVTWVHRARQPRQQKARLGRVLADQEFPADAGIG